MAEALAKKYGKKRFVFSSADSKPADKVNSMVVLAMNEKGINISRNKPKLLTCKMAENVDLVVTMGCNVQGICAGPFSKPSIDWQLEDPKGKSIEKVREIRDQIELRVKKLIIEEL
jgi:protein-tyrosine-phosphatase